MGIRIRDDRLIELAVDVLIGKIREPYGLFVAALVGKDRAPVLIEVVVLRDAHGSLLEVQRQILCCSDEAVVAVEGELLPPPF
ncbi:MAG: hypothetical protein ACFN4G_06040 [Mitsuokella sp.]